MLQVNEKGGNFSTTRILFMNSILFLQGPAGQMVFLGHIYRNTEAPTVDLS